MLTFVCADDCHSFTIDKREAGIWVGMTDQKGSKLDIYLDLDAANELVNHLITHGN